MKDDKRWWRRFLTWTLATLAAGCRIAVSVAAGDLGHKIAKAIGRLFGL